MASCREVRSILSRAAEGESSPSESLRVARHLPKCTACRILLAREVRLAHMLEGIEDAVPVEGDFVERVMGALPDGPPAVAPVRKRRRGLAIAGLAGLAVLGVATLSRLLGSGSVDGPLPGLPRITYEGLESLDGILAGLVRVFMLVVARVGSGLEATFPSWSPGTAILPMLLVPLGAALVMISTLVALAAGYWRSQAIPRLFIRLLSVSAVIPSRLAAPTRSPRSSVNTRRT